jgi:phosphohistidine phosphatase SixA
MRFFFFVVILSLCFISCSRTVYVIRHGEKVTSDNASKMMDNDPPLSDAGKVRALVLKNELAAKHITHIYSTNTIRTRSTAEPLSQAVKVNVELYNNIDSLVGTIRSAKGNVLVVGHSNTVDDIVNKLCGQTKIATDLNDGEYDNLFVVKIKGKKVVFEKRKYGYPSNP